MPRSKAIVCTPVLPNMKSSALKSANTRATAMSRLPFGPNIDPAISSLPSLCTANDVLFATDSFVDMVTPLRAPRPHSTPNRPVANGRFAVTDQHGSCLYQNPFGGSDLAMTISIAAKSKVTIWFRKNLCEIVPPTENGKTPY